MFEENFSQFRLLLFESPQNFCKFSAATVAFPPLTLPLPLQTCCLSFILIPAFSLFPLPSFSSPFSALFLLFFMFFFIPSKAFSCHFHFHFLNRANCSSCLPHTLTLFPSSSFPSTPFSRPSPASFISTQFSCCFLIHISLTNELPCLPATPCRPQQQLHNCLMPHATCLLPHAPCLLLLWRRAPRKLLK